MTIELVRSGNCHLAGMADAVIHTLCPRIRRKIDRAETDTYSFGSYLALTLCTTLSTRYCLTGRSQSR